MSSWVVRSLLLCAVFGAVFCDSSEIQVVENIIANSNKLFREHNRTEIDLPDIGWIFEPVQYREGRLGQFDTLELLPNPQIESRVNHYGTLYNFNVSMALRNLTLNYKFHINYPFFGQEGNLTITVNKKAFQAEGRVLVKNNGSCYAILQDARVAEFGDFKVKVVPDNAPYFTQLYEAILNIVHEQVVPLINLRIRSEIRTTNFREQFNKNVCDEVNRNSTTEAPTEEPTTDATTLPPRRPHHPTKPHHPSTHRPSTRKPHHPTHKPHHPTHKPHHPTRRPHHTTTEDYDDY